MRVGLSSRDSRLHRFTGGSPINGLGVIDWALLAASALTAATTIAKTRYEAKAAGATAQTQSALLQFQAQQEARRQQELQVQQQALLMAQAQQRASAVVPPWLVPTVVGVSGALLLSTVLRKRR